LGRQLVLYKNDSINGLTPTGFIPNEFNEKKLFLT
jgi:hypothetical protein